MAERLHRLHPSAGSCDEANAEDYKAKPRRVPSKQNLLILIHALVREREPVMLLGVGGRGLDVL